MIFLSVDFGTSAVKLSVVDHNGRVLDWAKHEYPYILLPGEKSEIDPCRLMGALYTAASRLKPQLLNRVECLCYDTFSPSLVLMDQEGELVYPNIITHLDRRSRPQTETINQLIGNEAYREITGFYPFPGGCSAMTLLWFLQQEPEALKRTYRIGHLTTYLHKLFTGRWMVDLVNASMTGLYQTTTQSGWSEELIDLFSFQREWFDEIKNPGTVYGSLLPSAAARLGIPSGIPVTVGTNDVAAAQMGAGNTQPGSIMNTAGSSEMVSILTSHPIGNPKYYLRNAALPGLWQIYATTAGGFAVDWFYSCFCRELSKDEYYNDYIVQAIEENLTDQSVTFDPYLTGDRQSLEKKTGGWHGLTLAATRKQLLAAMLKSIQGVLFETVSQAAQFQELSQTIKISGGMVTPAYLKLKSLSFPGYQFQQADDCPILGNVELAKYYL